MGQVTRLEHSDHHTTELEHQGRGIPGPQQHQPHVDTLAKHENATTPSLSGLAKQENATTPASGGEDGGDGVDSQFQPEHIQP